MGTIAGAATLTVQSVTAVSANTAWVVCDDLNNGGGRLYYTTDGGNTWTRQLSTGFTSTTNLIDGVAALAGVPGRLKTFIGYAGGFAASPTSGGMFRVMLPAVALATTTARPLAGLAVYPNPANDRFTVAVPAIADAAQVQATLYNTLGQAVACQPASLPAAGRQLGFPNTGLAPGLYTLRVQAGETIASK